MKSPKGPKEVSQHKINKLTINIISIISVFILIYWSADKKNTHTNKTARFYNLRLVCCFSSFLLFIHRSEYHENYYSLKIIRRMSKKIVISVNAPLTWTRDSLSFFLFVFIIILTRLHSIFNLRFDFLFLHFIPSIHTHTCAVQLNVLFLFVMINMWMYSYGVVIIRCRAMCGESLHWKKKILVKAQVLYRLVWV